MPFTIDTAYTLAEVLKSYDPEGKLHHIIDPFQKKLPILEEGHWEEANGDIYHEFLQLVSKPTGAFTRINEGYANEGSETKPAREQLAMIGCKSEVDIRLLDRQSDPVAWRSKRSQLAIKGMLEAWHTKFWTGSAATDPKEVDGLFTRYNATTYSNVKSLAGSANLYPVGIIKWGSEDVSLLHPKGGVKFFKERDMGLVDLADSSDTKKTYPGYRSYFDFSYGIMVGKQKHFQRLVNVDATAIKNDSAFEDALIEVLNHMEDLENVAIYVGEQIMTGLEQRLNAKANVNYVPGTVWGRPMLVFKGCPILRDDSLSTAESVVS